MINLWNLEPHFDHFICYDLLKIGYRRKQETDKMEKQEIQNFLNNREETGLRVILNMVLDRSDGKYVLEQTIEKYRSVLTERENQNKIREFVIEHLHWDGKYRNCISEYDHQVLYGMADGFGLLTSKELSGINDGYDWSHIRDSSPEAFKRMADYIKEIQRKRDG